MAKTIEITIRDDAAVVYTSVADVDDNFDQDFLAAYSLHYPGVTDNSELYSKAARGILDTVMNFVGMMTSTPARQFSIRGEVNTNPSRVFNVLQQIQSRRDNRPRPQRDE